MGGRSLSDLKKFAGDLKPLCSPFNKDKCSEEELSKIEKVEKMSMEALTAAVKKGEESLEEAEKKMKDGVTQLQAFYKLLQDESEKIKKEIKDSGLQLQKAVLKKREKDG